MWGVFPFSRSRVNKFLGEVEEFLPLQSSVEKGPPEDLDLY